MALAGAETELNGLEADLRGVETWNYIMDIVKEFDPSHQEFNYLEKVLV